MTKNPSTHADPPAIQFSPRLVVPQCRPLLGTVWHGMRRCQSKQGSHSGSKTRTNNQAKLLLSWHRAWTHSKSSQATQHLSHNTGKAAPSHSLLNRPWCKVCLNHLLQGASSHLCCSPHTKGSERGHTSGCRKLREKRFPLLRTSAQKKLKLDGATQVTQHLPLLF